MPSQPKPTAKAPRCHNKGKPIPAKVTYGRVIIKNNHTRLVAMAGAFLRLEDDEAEESIAKALKTPNGFFEALCCVKTAHRDQIGTWMIADDAATIPPSLMQRLLCQCGPSTRVPNGIERIPEIASLAGGTLQFAPPDWPTRGSVQSLRACQFDAQRRRALIQVFGGFGGPSSEMYGRRIHALRASHARTPGCCWKVLLAYARLA
jgi:hypothetical protein